MAEKQPAFLLIAAGIIAAGVGIAYGAVRVYGHGTPGMHLLGKLLGLLAFFVILIGIACSVFAFGVDFR